MQNHTKIISLLLLLLAITSAGTADDSPALLDIMKDQLNYTMKSMSSQNAAPLYYLSYTITEEKRISISADDGGLNAINSSLNRYLDVDMRVGSVKLDNTHEIRSDNWMDNYSPRRAVSFPVEPIPQALKAALWDETEYQYLKSQERYSKVLANRQVKVEEEDLSDDFSARPFSIFTEETAYSNIDTTYWKNLTKKVAQYIAGFPFVYNSKVSLSANDKTNYFVNSENSALQHSNHYLVLRIEINGMAEDGMELERSEQWCTQDVSRLPGEETVMKSAERLLGELKDLINAPVTDPYIGPAILINRASGVFFHEIFGHRIEGQEQKYSDADKTFTKKINEKILPDFISVIDDPTIPQFKGKDLRGYYKFDDEGTPSQKVVVVDKGIMKNFLMTRSPIENFPATNGHARRDYGYEITSRQGNLMVLSDKIVPYKKLRELLIEECKKQGKPYGLIFEDIAGGFTYTGRYAAQAFKVIPLYVVRVYADGRPDEPVRGVDIVGTPLTSFSKILCTGDDIDAFNGTCGASSGMVPVSAVSPSILVSEIEVQKTPKSQEKPPILPPPGR